jgi:ABC-2 type transport system ATP-binding protein
LTLTQRQGFTLIFMTTSTITASALRKSFGDHVVLDGIDLDIAAGTVFALLGPNGAGKTTAVRILCTQLPADSGTMTVAGRDLTTDPDGVRAAIGVTGQFSAVDTLMTGRENLRLMADLWRLDPSEGRARADELLTRLDLLDAADRVASTYSGGMVRRLDLAMTLMSRPQVVFLDEPTTGLDPRSRRTVWEIVEELVADGVTVLLTTQQLEEADRLADRIALLDGGRIVAQGSPDELKRSVPGGHLRLDFADEAALQAALSALADGARRVAGSDAVEAPSDGSVRQVREVLDRLDAAGIEVARLAVRTPDLDDVFLALTGRTATHEDDAASDDAQELEAVR